MRSREDLKQWDGQSPAPRINVQELINKQGKVLPKFGPYAELNKQVNHHDLALNRFIVFFQI